MPVVTVRRKVKAKVVKPKHPKMKLILENGRTLTVPYAPVSVSHDGLSGQYQEMSRYGRTPLLLRSGDGLDTISFSLIIAHRDSQRSVEKILAALKHIAKARYRVRTVLGPSENGWYRVTSFSFESAGRQHGSNRITRAVANLTLTRASDARLRVSPLTGGASTPPAPSKKKSGSSSSTRRHKVKSGDTLWKIAQRYLGDGNKWKRIADANKIKDARKIRVGQVLVIP